MSADRDLERRIGDFYATEVPPRAPDWVLRTALETIDSTPQRRAVIRVPWRFPPMNTFTKVVIAAVIVIAVGALGLSVLRPSGSSNVGGPPTASPAPSPTASPSPSPSASPITPPALTETFTSQRYGFSVSYPTGWLTRPATRQWTTGFPDFTTEDGDVINDPVQESSLWIMVASQPLADTSATQWMDDMLAQQGADCAAPIETITLVGGQGKVCGTAIAVASAGDRGYLITLYVSRDDPAIVAAYDQEYFREILATLQLRPDDAVDTSASPSS